jgi:hypothetical protein
MPEPAFLVEGQMEKFIVQRLCPQKPVRLIGCNGDDVSMAAIAKAVDARIRVLQHYSPIVIILDRERRQEPCEELINQLSQLLDEKQHRGRYIIGMPDRTIENWILSDWAHILEEDNTYLPLSENMQGLEHGKSVIRKLMPAGIFYHETTVGVELFLKCRPVQMFAASDSFRALVSRLDNIECWWLKPIDSRFDPISWSTPPPNSPCS